jgi:hypothetical protein
MFSEQVGDSTISDDDKFNMFLDSLDTSKHYTFLLTSNDDNKIVSSNDNLILFVGAFERETNKYLSHETLKPSNILTFKFPERIEINNVQDILDYVNSVDYKKEQGLFAISNSEFKMFKIINDEYKRKSLLRGNNSSLYHRYLQLVYLQEEDMMREFTELFSDKSKLFDCVNLDLGHVVLYLFNVYYQRYISKQFVFVHPVFHSVLKSIHNWHLQDRIKNKISVAKVEEQVYSTDVNTIFQMLKQYTQMKDEITF